MNSVKLPDDCAKQWEILLLLLSAEEKKIDRTGDSEIDTMNYFCNNEGIRKILLQWLKQMQSTYAKKMSESDTALKCDNVSLWWRQRGNDKYRANNIEESYYCYSKSVVYAHQNGPMYSLALANRSAALLRMKRFAECLSDVELAIGKGYPSEQRHKLLLRRADCHIEMGQREEAYAALKAATEHAATLNLTSISNAEFDRHIKLLEKKLEVVLVVKEDEVDVLPECFLGENPDFYAASNALELKRSDTAGRFVVAKEATRRGDVLFSEEPYAWVTLPTAEEFICETCCRSPINCVPCETCSRSVYCSEACRARGLELFHRWECIGAQFSLFPTIGIAHLALRVLLISASHGFPPLGPHTPACKPPRSPLAPSKPPLAPHTPASKPPRSPLAPTKPLRLSNASASQPQRTPQELFAAYSRSDNLQIYKRDTHPFYRMFHLVTNFDKMNNTDYVQYALTATVLNLYLEHCTSFFDYLPSRVPGGVTDARLFSAALLLRAMGQLVCNGHAALQLATVHEGEGDSRTVTEREVRRATAIYPSAAMMNHSCDPNIINTFYNNRLIVRCARETPSGDEVLNCYGPHRAREPAKHRRAQLRAQYLFTCNCTACTDTERKDFVLVFSAYACQSCKGPVYGSTCVQCRAPLKREHARSLLERADDLDALAIHAPNLESRCELSHAALRLRQQAWHRHHAALRDAADNLARLYADLGDFSKSVEIIKQNIQSLEYQFGSFSVEVAHELRKLSDVMLERIINCPQNPDYRDWCLETHKVIKKAVQLMELNYGSWEPLVKRLKQQETLVASQLDMSRTPDSDSVHHSLHYNLKI